MSSEARMVLLVAVRVLNRSILLLVLLPMEAP